MHIYASVRCYRDAISEPISHLSHAEYGNLCTHVETIRDADGSRFQCSQAREILNYEYSIYRRPSVAAVPYCFLIKTPMKRREEGFHVDDRAGDPGSSARWSTANLAL